MMARGVQRKGKNRGDQKASFNETLLKTLEKVDRPGDFCVGADHPMTLPGLEVNGLGPVGLPMNKSIARKLIKLCDQAPYGKGTETVVDTAVRRVWELDPSKFELTNSKWDDCLKEIVKTVQESLGLGQRKLTANLYKLLVYEKGGFFLPHRDGEKLDRMVATLVVALPSKFEGGELIVSHEGRDYAVAFDGAAGGHELSYAAFYADCQHEVRPVRGGYRLCLTYNLTLSRSAAKRGIGAPSYGTVVDAVSKRLDQWRSQDTECDKLAITLEHKYTQDGLTIDKLKGVDRAQAEVLLSAAEQSGCVGHLALVTLWQHGSAEGGYDPYAYGYSGRRRYRSDFDDEEDESGDTSSASDYEMGEIIDGSLTAKHWSDSDGRKVDLGEIDLDENEIVSPVPLEEGDPDEEDFEGYTGNAGMTLERWYHRAAVVIWPRESHFSILCSAGTGASVGGLKVMVQRLKRLSAKKRESLRAECLEFANAIIENWSPEARSWHTDRAEASRDSFLPSLCELDAPDLIQRFLKKVLPTDGGVRIDKTFIAYAKKLDWKRFQKELIAIIKATDATTIGRNAGLLRKLATTARDKNSERVSLCQTLAATMVDVVFEFDKKQGRPDWQAPRLDRAELLGDLAVAMMAVNANRPLEALVRHSFASEKYDLTDDHLKAIFGLEKQLVKRPKPNRGIERWIEGCRGELERRTKSAPRPPADFCRPSNLSCKCADCRALAKFLDDPNTEVGRFPLAKQRRHHLHNTIDSNRCDCTHTTERRGRPYTLVCKKTTASHNAACKIYQRDTKNLARIVKLRKKLQAIAT